jgi:AP2-associated kinase
VRLCDFGSCVTGHIYVRNVEEKAAAEEIIGKETTPMYRSPEMIDLYMRDILTEKTDIWVKY